MAVAEASPSGATLPEPHREPEAALPTRNAGLVMVALMSAMVMQLLDTTIANVSLPHMQAGLGAGQDSISWVLTSYIIAVAIATPLSGWLADRVGARQLIILAVVGFVITSMLCGMAANLTQMVIFRILQGLAGALIAPICQSLILDIHKPSEQPRAMSIFSAGMTIGPVIGPVLGGVLTEHLNWRWVFFINLPVGVLCVALLIAFLPNKPVRRRPFDGLGYVMLALAIGAFQLALDRGEHQDWLESREILIEFALAAAMIWMFVVHLLTTRKMPLFDPGLFRDRNLVAGSLFMAMVGTVMLSSLALLPSLMQSLYGYDAVDTGALLMSRSIGAFITMSTVARMIEKVDLRMVVLAGLLIAAMTLWQMTTWSLDTDGTTIFVNGFFQGFGLGMVFTPLNIMAFATLPARYRTDGSALFNLARSLGASVGIAVTTAQLTRNMQVSHSDLAQQVTGARLMLDLPGLQALGIAGERLTTLLNAEVTRQAAMIAYIGDFKLMLFACLAAVPLVAILRKSSKGAAPPVQVGD